MSAQERIDVKVRIDSMIGKRIVRATCTHPRTDFTLEFAQSLQSNVWTFLRAQKRGETIPTPSCFEPRFEYIDALKAEQFKIERMSQHDIAGYEGKWH